MKRGVKLPEERRDDMAREALAMVERGETLADVEAAFDISNPTARNLVSRGRFLRRNPPC